MAGLQYLRARWYDAGVGRFNRLDPFEGRTGDPLTLHKYAYCHGNPVMGVDPTGEVTLMEVLQVAARVGQWVAQNWTYLKYGLVIYDVVRAYQIFSKAYATGQPPSTWEWVELAFITINIVTIAPMAKAILGRVLHMTAATGGGTVGVRAMLAVCAKNGIRVIDSIEDAHRVLKSGAAAKAGFGITSKLKPVIVLSKGGRSLRGLVHEFCHFLVWKWFGRGMSKRAYDIWKHANEPVIEKTVEELTRFILAVW